MAVSVWVEASDPSVCGVCGDNRVLMRGVDWPEEGAVDIPCPHCHPPFYPLVYLPQQEKKP